MKIAKSRIMEGMSRIDINGKVWIYFSGYWPIAFYTSHDNGRTVTMRAHNKAQSTGKHFGQIELMHRYETIDRIGDEEFEKRLDALEL